MIEFMCYKSVLYFKVFLKATSHINKAIIDKQYSINLNIMVPYVDIIGLYHSVAIL